MKNLFVFAILATGVNAFAYSKPNCAQPVAPVAPQPTQAASASEGIVLAWAKPTCPQPPPPPPPPPGTAD